MGMSVFKVWKLSWFGIVFVLSFGFGQSFISYALLNLWHPLVAIVGTSEPFVFSLQARVLPCPPLLPNVGSGQALLHALHSAASCNLSPFRLSSSGLAASQDFFFFYLFLFPFFLLVCSIIL